MKKKLTIRQNNTKINIVSILLENYTNKICIKTEVKPQNDLLKNTTHV